jgi:type IV pilus assembly protein PilM
MSAARGPDAWGKGPLLFSRPTKAIGLDIGSHSVKAVQVSKPGGRVRVDNVGYALVDRAQMGMDPTVAQGDAVREALRTMPLSQCIVVGALPGQTVVIRYPRFNDVADQDLDAAVQREAGQNVPFDLGDVFLDWTLLDKATEGEKTVSTVLLVAAKHEVIESRVMVADEAEVKYNVLGVDSLALADAAEGCDFLRVGESVALVNLGATTTSIHFVKDGISNFIRDVNWGARELIQAIAKGRRCEIVEAERLLVNSAAETDEQPEAPPDQPAEAAPAPGGGAGLLEPLDDELGDLGDLGSDLGGGDLGGASAPAAEAVDKGLGDLLAMPLSRLVAEIRRSFDFYEQQLYEKPVDRLILSGGVAHVPLVGQTLSDDLGLEAEVADPANSALMMGSPGAVGKLTDQPAQFMVAVGLAARGIREL